MRFGLLGPLSVREGETELRISGSKLRALLVVLLLNANHQVSFRTLRTALWGDDPPATADASLRNQITRLRRVLGDEDGTRLRTAPGGYVLVVESDELDTQVFEQALRRARTALLNADWETLGRETAAALAVWRGTPLTELPDPAHAELLAQQLQQDRLQALEWHFEAELALGRPAGLVRELTRLVDDHPLHEAFHRQLMLALHQSGQRAEALAVFQRLRRRLVDELGIEPGPAARQAHEAILQGGGDTRRTGGTTSPATPEPTAPAPRQLPSAIGHFTGRDETLRALDELARPGGAGGHRLVAVVGSAGIGKTALAVHWAQRLAPCFPDGCLYVNLQGFDPSPGPAAPDQVVRGFLQALGVSHGQLPSAAEDQIGLYRSLLAQRRILVLLDNARDAEQVRPLLPGGSACLTIVTSRDRLTGLVAVDGAQPVHLGLLAPDEAFALLARRVGDERAHAEPVAVKELVELCGRLPLALNIAAARLAAAPAGSLDAYVSHLRRSEDGLRMFDVDDPAANLRTVFSWSYQRLSPPAARLFRILGVHPGPDLGVAVCVGLADGSPARALELLEELTRLHLIEQRQVGRYVLHDLLRAFARELGTAVDGQAASEGAERRILDHYLHSAFAAERRIQPARPPIEPVAAHPAADPVAFADPAEAVAWFDAEIQVLLACTARAAAAGLDAHAWQIPWALTTYMYRAGRWHDLVEALTEALDAVRRLGDLPGQTRVRIDLGQALDTLRAFDRADAHYQAALELSIASGNLDAQARAQYSIGAHCHAREQYADALVHMRRAVELYRESGHTVGQAIALNAVGFCHAKSGDQASAIASATEALALHRAAGNNPAFEADTLDTLGFAHHQLGDTARAAEHYRESATLFSHLGERQLYARSLMRLGDVHASAGEWDAARRDWSEALDILTALDHPSAAAVRERLRTHGL